MNEINLTLLSPWGWLLLGGMLRLFDFGKRMIPLAAWLAPLFLLHFARSMEPLTGIAAIWLALFLAALVAYRGVIPVPGAAYPLTVAALALFWALPYLADRLLAPQLPGFASTLVFPAAWVAVEFLFARLSPFGSWGSIAYTQYGNLPLMQFASISGLWGVTFLVTWFGSTINWAWDNRLDWSVVGGGLMLYAIILGLVMLAGGARLAFVRQGKTLRVATIGWPEGILDIGSVLSAVMAGNLADSGRDALRKSFQTIQDHFLSASVREARAGAKIIVWPEANLLVFHEDEAAFLETARDTAKAEKIFLLIGMATLQPGISRPLENKAVLIDPNGEHGYSYTKSRPVPGWESMLSVRGDGRVVSQKTALGRVGSVICYDMDFPQLLRQAGRARIDTLLVPASDFEPIQHLHHVMASFRVVENGASLVRATRWGISAVVDAYGRTLASMDDSVATSRVMVGQLPLGGLRTLYPIIGDSFAWLCVAGLLLLSVISI